MFFLVPLLASVAHAQQTPSCPGDCDLDGEVRIDELLRGVNFLLAGDPAAGCDELDDNRDGQVVVNEMILAVLKALNGCRLTDEAAAEAAAGAAVGVVDSFQVLDIGGAAASAPGSGGAAALAADIGGRRSVGAAPDMDHGNVLGSTGGQTPPCGSGGSVEESCSSDATSSQLTITFANCRTPAGQRLEIVQDGRLVRRVDDGLYCSTRQLADGARVSEELTAFRQAIEGGDGIVFDFTGTYRHDYVPGPGACAGRTNTEIYDGTLSLRCAPGLRTAACPPAGRDVSLVARNLTVIRGSTGAPGACVRSRMLLGRLELRDAISGQAFDAVYRQFAVDDLLGSVPFPISLQGALALDCVGEVNVITEVRLLRAGDERCPSAGLLFVRLPDGLQRGVRYERGGVEIDLDGDGKPDVSAASCEDRSLAQCE